MDVVSDYPWLNALREAVKSIAYKDWQFIIDIESYGAPYLQIRFEDPTMTPTTQYCRKWLLYPTMNVDDFIRTAWAAVLQAEEHEARERFAYKGRHVMSPHLSIDALVELSRWKKNLSLSPDPEPS